MICGGDGGERGEGKRDHCFHIDPSFFMSSNSLETESILLLTSTIFSELVLMSFFISSIDFCISSVFFIGILINGFDFTFYHCFKFRQ